MTGLDLCILHRSLTERLCAPLLFLWASECTSETTLR